MQGYLDKGIQTPMTQGRVGNGKKDASSVESDMQVIFFFFFFFTLKPRVE